MSVFNHGNAPASPPERRAASDCGCDGSVGFPGSAAYILFDLDGTLTDPKEGITRCVQYALSKFGIQAECDALTNFIGPPLEESFGRFYGLSPADSKKAVGYYRERFTDVGIFENGVIDGIPELLLALSGAGAVLALATSKPQVFAARILEKYNLSAPFSVVVGSELDGRRSDKAEVVALALEKLGVQDRRAAVMVGDRRHDVIGAHKNGVRACGVTFGYAEPGELEACGADRIASSAIELKEILLCFCRTQEL
ncbi:MAG: HAD hydrolase-like protein [Candidatus Woodwardiibium sp.]